MILVHKVVMRKIAPLGEDNINMCKDVVIETKLMQLHVENDLHEDVELQSELRHATNVLIDEHENVELPSQSNVKSIVGYISIIFESTLVSQLNGNPTLSKDR